MRERDSPSLVPFSVAPELSGALFILCILGIESSLRYIREFLPVSEVHFKGLHAALYTSQRCYVARIYELRYEIQAEALLLDKA